MAKKKDYSDIINLPHPVSKKHARMPLEKRAAQFSPFAALKGHKEACVTEARCTVEKAILSPEEKEKIDKKLREAVSEKEKKFTFTWFQKDETKDGGKYITRDMHIKKIDLYERMIYFLEGEKIRIDDLKEIKKIYS